MLGSEGMEHALILDEAEKLIGTYVCQFISHHRASIPDSFHTAM